MTSQTPIRSRLVVIIIFFIAIGVLGWFLRHTGTERPKITNVVLISLDTCRADHLGCYGYPGEITPNIDAIAKEGVLCRNVLAPTPITLPSHSSMLTGTVPPYHGVHTNFDYQLDESYETLAEILKARQFATGAILSAYVLDTKFGLDQGFDTYHDQFAPRPDGRKTSYRKGDKVNQQAFSWLAEHSGSPFFLFLHYFDPHGPYEPPEPFASRFPDSPYAGEVAYTDYCIGQIVEKLKELGLYDSTLIVITADHGEMLGEHGEWTHGYFIYEGSVKVPLIFKLPGQHQREITELVGLIDIVPTVCGLLGIETEAVWQGVDLSDCLWKGADPPEGRSLYCESLVPMAYDGNSLLGVVTDRWKYIQTTRPELYDLIKDPGEATDLSLAETQRASDMQLCLQEMIETQSRSQSDSALKLDEQSRRRLEGLGYIGGGSTADAFAFDTSKEDPKDLLYYHASAAQLSQLFDMKRYDEAKRLGEQLLEQRPQFQFACRTMGRIAMQQGDYEKAISYFSRLVELNADNASAHHALGRALQSVGRLDEAIGHFRQALAMRPDHAGTRRSLENALLQQRKANQAGPHSRPAIRRFQEVKPDDARSHCKLGIALKSQGRFDEALKHLHQAIELEPGLAEAHNALGSALAATGRFAEAVASYKEAVRYKPDDPPPLNNLAWVLATCSDASVRDTNQAVELAERACALSGHKNPMFLDTLAAAQAAAGQFDKAVSTIQAAIALAQEAQAKELAEDFRTRLELYQQNKPYLQVGK